MRHCVLFLLCSSTLWAATVTRAQNLTVPYRDWRTVETKHFRVHYTSDMSEWSLDAASRLESVHASVSTLVGYEPKQIIDVVVADPLSAPNGFALPLLDGPAMFFFPTPPDPVSVLSHHRGWGEILSIHEYAHIAHLSRPSRNSFERWRRRLTLDPRGPVLAKSPPWLYEGYATVVEGKLTGSGRPHSAVRASILRQLALEGRLPSYGEINRTEPFLGGAMRYLVGSAFLEWLENRGVGIGQRGAGNTGRRYMPDNAELTNPESLIPNPDSALVHLWRRMSARKNRSFAAAFRGVFGDNPDILYARFRAELTAKAFEMREQLEAQGIVHGELIQKLEWYAGAPAVSADGRLIAIRLSTPERPSRIVIWRTEPESEDSAATRRRARLLEKDPLDVPDIEIYPRAKKAIATLFAVGGRSHEFPRFFADGERLLVSRLERLADGTLRPDLFIWNMKTKTIERVTRGAGVRYGDPSPDGSSAAGVRCIAGKCDLVRVDLASGVVSVLAPGTPARTYAGARFSPDGRQVATAVHENGRWRIAIVGVASGFPRVVDPDDGADRHSPSWLRGKNSLVYMSEKGGVPNLERLDLASPARGPRALTRVTGLAMNPEATGRSVYFLDFHGRGFDLRKVSGDTILDATPSPLSAALQPVAPVTYRGKPNVYVATPLAPRGYGMGPIGVRPLLAGNHTPEGRSVTLALVAADPVGRLGATLQGSIGERGTWRGGSASFELRRFRPLLTADLFAVRHQPSRQRAGTFAPPSLDADYAGSTLIASLVRSAGSQGHRFRIGGSLGRLDFRQEPADRTRALALAEYRWSSLYTRDRLALAQRLALHASVGKTAGERWDRVLGSASFELSAVKVGGVRAHATYGVVNEDAPVFERFIVGGAEPWLFDPSILTQRVALAGQPLGVVGGRKVASLRGDLTGRWLEPFYSIMSAGATFDDWYRVIGAESSIRTDAIPIARVPGLSARLGVAYALDEPYPHKLRGYATASFRP